MTGERSGETESEHKNGIEHFSTFKGQSCWSTTMNQIPENTQLATNYECFCISSQDSSYY